MLSAQGAAAVEAELHDGAEELRLGDDLRAYVGFLDVVDEGGCGKSRGVVDVDNLALGSVDLVGDVGHRGDHVHVEFAEQALLHDLEVQQAQEAAAESGAERQRALGLIDEGGVVELELLEHRAQFLELVGLHGVHAREHHGLHLLEAGDRLGAGGRHVGYGVADLDLGSALYARDHVAHVAAAYLGRGHELHLEHSDLLDLVFHSGGEELDLLALAYASVHDLAVGYHPAERVEHRVEDQGLQRRLRVAFRCGDLVHYRVEQRGHALAGAGGDLVDLLGLASQQLADLVGHELHLGGVHVYLVEHGDYLQPVVDGHVEVGDGLRLDALGRVHHEQRPFARGDRAGDLVGEVHVARGVDEVQPVGLASAVVEHLYRVALDGDALLLLEVHVVEDLVLHVAFAERPGEFQQPVGKRALAVVDMRYYAEVPDVFHKQAQI